MKRYFVDQAIFLLFGVAIAICIPFICGPISSVVLEIIIALCWGYLCRRILLMPLDLICGPKNKSVCFSTQLGIEDFEFFKGKHCCEWKFYYSNNKILKLLVPLENANDEKERPIKDEKIDIVYYRFSKILCRWTERDI